MDIITIKRYSNRKLYNTETSKYVTLPQITGLVRSGRTILVLDNKTGRDLTSITLLQSLVQKEKELKQSLGDQIAFTLLLESALRSETGTISGYIQDLEDRLVEVSRLIVAE